MNDPYSLPALGKTIMTIGLLSRDCFLVIKLVHFENKQLVINPCPGLELIHQVHIS